MILPLVVAEQELETDIMESVIIRQVLLINILVSAMAPYSRLSFGLSFRRVLDHFVDEGTTTLDLVTCFKEPNSDSKNKSALPAVTFMSDQIR